jgi:hypothetical protein
MLDAQLLAQGDPNGRGEPRSEVSCAGTPYLEIQLAMRVSAQVAAAISRMGSATSTTVNRYLLLQVAAGRGPTMSTSGTRIRSIMRWSVLPALCSPKSMRQNSNNPNGVQIAVFLMSIGCIGI